MSRNAPRRHRRDDPVFSTEPPSLDDVSSSPGHLIRRSRQISTPLFAEEAGRPGLTSVQHTALVAIRERPGTEKRALGRLVAIDRSTIGTVLEGLDDKSLMTRRVLETDLRVMTLDLTGDGEALLAACSAAVASVQRPRGAGGV